MQHEWLPCIINEKLVAKNLSCIKQTTLSYSSKSLDLSNGMSIHFVSSSLTFAFLTNILTTKLEYFIRNNEQKPFSINIDE